MSRFSDERTLVDSFEDLTILSPPDISEHPAFSGNGTFSSRDRPQMITTSGVTEVRSWADDRRRIEAERNVDPNRNLGRVKFNFLPQQIVPVPDRRPLAARTSNLDAMDNPFNARPMPPPEPAAKSPYRSSAGSRNRADRKSTESQNTVKKIRNKKSQLQINTTRPSSDTEPYESFRPGSPTGPVPALIHPKTPVDSPRSASTPVSETFDTKKSSLRKVTDLFKQKSDKQDKQSDKQIDTASPLSVSARAVDGGPLRTFQRPDLERYLRTSLNVQTYDYSPDQPYPRHPNTGRAWHSRNLKCTTCMDACCAVCGRACCAYKAAYLATKIHHKDNPESLLRAQETLGNISNCFAYGQEAPTFLQCTHGAPGGDKIGCGKWVCPDCCGMCPNPVCADVQCRKCKKNPWMDCIWHDENMNRLAI
ncbi:hypothetical protein LTR20_000345 [Exophiala xenobiotica]|nr:hypothetical protein LTS13_004731 [Exophiala xenobiotica]KAK5396190.1 hypothetical protein LTR79_005917 [Exophiala xenobiotica]KAK5424928.1 hypothetical protein LTR90_000519 [Exophiala xenobiotica]KAK5472886.1 hypothetical protein LTR20_000345 [Exophiala xenobiotica]KAK5500825.1 hypothetical protein LTR26_000517 [Exophiala xenobiotica]